MFTPSFRFCSPFWPKLQRKVFWCLIIPSNTHIITVIVTRYGDSIAYLEVAIDQHVSCILPSVNLHTPLIGSFTISQFGAIGSVREATILETFCYKTYNHSAK